MKGMDNKKLLARRGLFCLSLLRFVAVDRQVIFTFEFAVPLDPSDFFFKVGPRYNCRFLYYMKIKL